MVQVAHGSAVAYKVGLMRGNSGPGSSRLGLSAARLSLFAFGYSLSVLIGERLYGSLAVPSPFWFPDSVLLSALLLTRREGWWVLLGTAGLIRLVAGAVPGTPIWFVLTAVSIDLLKGLGAAWWLQRVLGPPVRLGSLRELTAFLGIAALSVPLISALVVAPARQMLGDPFWPAVYRWFMGDAVAQVVVTPALIYWCTRAYKRVNERMSELVLISLGLFVVLYYAFVSRLGATVPLLVYTPVPFLTWAAVRLRPFGAANAIGLVAAASMFSVVNGTWGFLGGGSPDQDVLSLQLFLLVIGIPMLLLAVVTVQRETDLEELRVVLDAAPVAILKAKDRACREIIGNPAACDLYQVSVGTNLSLHVTQPFRLTRDGADIPLERLPMQQAAASANTVTGEALTLERPDGTKRHLFGNAVPLWDDYGKIRGAVGAFQDITEVRLAEQALRESEERFRLVAGTAPVMIWMSGTDKLCIYFNKGWLDFRGRTHEEEVGNGWQSGVHPDDLERYLGTYVGAFEARVTFEMEYRLCRRDGEYRWVVDHGVPRFDPGGNFCGYIGSCLDITDRKVAEGRLQELSGRLIGAQEQARARFARDLHDDLGQRMTLIQLNIERFAGSTDGLSLEAHRQLRAVLRTLAEMTADIQSMSHRLHPSTLDALGLVTALRAVCREFGEQAQLSVRFAHHDVPDDIAQEVCLSLFRVAQEALTNVVKHSGVTEATLDLSGSGDYLDLRISDAGAGFDLGSATWTSDAGLGLISMRERLRLVGGNLLVQTAPSRGTAIRATIPMRANGLRVNRQDPSPTTQTAEN